MGFFDKMKIIKYRKVFLLSKDQSGESTWTKIGGLSIHRYGLRVGKMFIPFSQLIEVKVPRVVIGPQSAIPDADGTPRVLEQGKEGVLVIKAAVGPGSVPIDIVLRILDADVSAIAKNIKAYSESQPSEQGPVTYQDNKGQQRTLIIIVAVVVVAVLCLVCIGCGFLGMLMNLGAQ